MSNPRRPWYGRRVSRIRPALLASVLSLAVAGCGGPLLLLPGGRLDGETRTAPDDWSFTDAVDTIQIETRPADPYSVNLWVTEADGALYLHAGATRSRWVEHLEADPRLRLRVDDAIYQLAATRVTEQAEFDRFSAAYEHKYGNPPRNPDVGEAYLFRLAAR